MKSRQTPEKNTKQVIFKGAKYPRKKHKTSYFQGCFSRVHPRKMAGKNRPPKTTPENTPEKNTIYICLLATWLGGRGTSRHDRTPKDGVKLRRRLQGDQHMTSKNCQTGGRA